jgi:hypothetical protein
MRIARAIAAENVLPYPVLEGITEAPIFLPSGDVLERPGYDEQTGLWYAPAADYPAVPSSPDHAAAVRAAVEIFEPFEEFPFVEDVDRAAFLAYVLSPLARTAIDEPAPMTSFDSPIRGSGRPSRRSTTPTTRSRSARPHGTSSSTSARPARSSHSGAAEPTPRDRWSCRCRSTHRRRPTGAIKPGGRSGSDPATSSSSRPAPPGSSTRRSSAASPPSPTCSPRSSRPTRGCGCSSSAR